VLFGSDLADNGEEFIIELTRESAMLDVWLNPPQDTPQTYQGHFGEFTITSEDRLGVLIYRGALVIAALCFALGSGLVLLGNSTLPLELITLCYAGFSLALGVSLWTIHIYMIPLHRTLQAFWGIGSIAAIAFSIRSSEPLALIIYQHPTTLFGIGFTFAALTGIYFKEAFCFNRLETKLLTPLVPALLLGQLAGFWPLEGQKLLLASWTVLFLIFAIRKLFQPIPQDIGDKSVFEHLHQAGQS
jgi:uncharacterized integral membrane protein